jgi:hypothetical protein
MPDEPGARQPAVTAAAASAAGHGVPIGPAPAAGGDLCRGLRWKGMFIDSPPDPTIPNPHDGFCWCRHTLTCLGPDGKVAETAACRPGRSCYEAP